MSPHPNVYRRSFTNVILLSTLWQPLSILPQRKRNDFSSWWVKKNNFKRLISAPSYFILPQEPQRACIYSASPRHTSFTEVGSCMGSPADSALLSVWLWFHIRLPNVAYIQATPSILIFICLVGGILITIYLLLFCLITGSWLSWGDGTIIPFLPKRKLR